MADPGPGPGEGGFGVAGGSGQRREEQERRRQSWMAEDADLWDGGSPQVPPLISA